MKIRTAALLAFAGLAVSAAQAQNITIPGPINVTAAITTQDLNGAGIPAGTYTKMTMSMDWLAGAGDPYTNEAVWALLNQATFAGATQYANPGVAFGSYGDGDPRTGMQWAVALNPTYTGGNPLFLGTQQTFAGSDAFWSNISISLTTGAIAPPAFTMSQTVAFPGLAQPYNNYTVSGDLAANTVTWMKITVPSGGVTVPNGRFLDINLENTAIAPDGDSFIIMYGPDGAIIASDDDDGSGFLSALSFGGSSTPRAAVGSGVASDGRDGILPAGDCYLAIAGLGDDFTSPLTRFYRGFNVFSGSPDATANPGDLKVNIQTGTVNAPTGCTGQGETEPNDTKAQANLFTMNNGDAICGVSTGTGTGTGATSFDYYLVQGVTPAAGQILQNRILYTSSTPTNTVTLRGLNQTGTGPGVVGTTDTTLQTFSATTSPARFVQWFTLGNDASANARRMYVRVAGVTGSAGDYRLEYQSTPVTPVESGVSLAAGAVTVSTVGSSTTDTDFWVYDQNLNPIADFASDDDITGNVLQGSATKTLSAGTYYIAISNWNMGNNLPSPASGNSYFGGAVTDFPGTLINSSTTANSDLTLLLSVDNGTPTPVVVTKAGAFDIRFVKFTVTGGATAGCNPADIACDTGDPLVSNPGCTNSTTGPNEGDYNAFFAANGFFFQAGQGLAGVGGFCDIACDNGDPLSQNPGCTNNGVNEGDYNCFFNNLFLPCV
ncbi:MAG: hypothetical protein IBJ18_07760 [Phycisphaerales bacterium]|nr:hypothetical protein [Phycisphaerales bacterium]